MSTLDSAVLDYIMTVKQNWPDWSIQHYISIVEGRKCQLCKNEIVIGERYASLAEHDKIRYYWHEPCLELTLQTNPDLRKTLRL